MIILNIIFDLIFTDDTPYSLVINLDKLEKFSDDMKDFVQKVKERLKSDKDNQLSVDYDVFCDIWQANEEIGIVPSFPVMVHDEFTLYEAD